MTSAQIMICHKPIFIIGSPRSGTSVLAHALAQHSALWTSAESDVLWHLYGNGQAEKAYARATARPNESDWLSRHHVKKPEFFAFLGLGINAMVTSRSRDRRWIDQTPQNTLMAEVLADLFPEALFVHMMRDGRKVVNSMIHFRNLLGEAGTNAFESTGRLPSWATNFEKACQTWCQYVEKALSFCQAHPDRSLTVVNDELVSDPEKGFTAMLAFVGVPFEKPPLEFFRTKRINTSFKPVDNDPNWVQSFPNPWCNWSEDQRAIFRQEAGATLVKCGMATDKELALGSEDI